eukprot:s26_g29.t1
MSYSDSTAVFKKRFLEIGLTSANFDAFNAEGLNTMGTFAFSCNYAPGSADERPLVTLATKVLGTEPSTKEMACIRRLFSEAYSTIAADIRSKVEASDESSVKKLALAERSQRLKDQQTRLAGLDLRGNYEPGGSLVDRCVASYESDRISYIPWDACVSRDHEILTGTRKDNNLSFDSSGTLKLAKKDHVEPCSTSNEMQVRYCLIRRGLGLDQANVMDFKKHDRLAEKLMNAKMEEPPQGCLKLSLKQIETADKKFWTLMAEKTRDGIKSTGTGRTCFNIVLHHLQPPMHLLNQGLLRNHERNVRKLREQARNHVNLSPPLKKAKVTVEHVDALRDVAANQFVGHANVPHPSRDEESNEDALRHAHAKHAVDDATANGSHVGPGTVDSCKQLVFIELCAGVLRSVPLHKNMDIVLCQLTANGTNINLDAKLFRWICQKTMHGKSSGILLKHVMSLQFISPHLVGLAAKPEGFQWQMGLRTPEYLLGVPEMSDFDRMKVTAANRLYERMGKLIQWLDSVGVAWVVENPTNSYLWELEYFAYAVQHGTFAHCHACAFGSTRPKKTSFLSNMQCISMMQLFCEDAPPHEHEPWGRAADGTFATSLEAQYPDGMCEQLVKFLDELCFNKGLQVQRADYKAPRVDKQPRGRSTPQLIPEYERVVTMLLPHDPSLDAKRCLTNTIRDVPAGSRLLRTEKKGNKLLCVFGIFHSCEKFTTLAKSLWHPFDLAAHMPDHLLRCLFIHLTKSPMEICKFRIATMKRWTSWALELACDEARYKKGLDSGVQNVLGSKRILLMEKIAKSIGWPDVELFTERSAGFRLVGTATKSNVFQPGLKAAAMSVEQLMKDAKFLKPALLGKIKANGRNEHGAELFDMTLVEATEKSWLRGPFTIAEVDQRHSGCWLPVRRFPVVQKRKLRPIDDFRENRVNESYSSTERASLYALDHLVWMAIFLMRLCKYGGEVSFELSDGSVLKGYVHREWLCTPVDLKITAMDLKAAYKQLPLNPKDVDKAVVSLWSEADQGVRCFECLTLPFGASASVHNFLRVSAFLQAAGCAAGLMWTSYFDDFPMLSHVCHTTSTLACAKGLMSLLGFVYSEEKLDPFGDTAEILGVLVDLTHSADSKLTISNKPSRVSELRDALDSIISAGEVVPTSMPSILGKLQYADSHVWGRAGKLAMADLRDIGHVSPQKVTLDSSHKKAMGIL